MSFIPLITKLNTFYGAYAPEFDVCAYGDCRDEAVNNLVEEVRSKEVAQTPEKGRAESHAVV